MAMCLGICYTGYTQTQLRLSSAETLLVVAAAADSAVPCAVLLHQLDQICLGRCHWPRVNFDYSA